MLSWIISSTVLVAIVIAMRYILKGKISLRLQYALWIPVVLRLLIPVSFGSTELSVMNAMESSIVESPSLSSPVVKYVDSETANIAIVEPDSDTSLSEQAKQYKINHQEWQTETCSAGLKTTTATLTASRIFFAIWLSGASIIALWLLIANLNFTSKLKRNRELLQIAGSPLPIYISEAIDAPCLFGLLRPAIYLTSEALTDNTIRRYSIEHEITHFSHGDYIWSLLRGVCLALHWYNPLVWWAATLSRVDAELACDEATIKRLGENVRAEYGRTLINMTCQKSPMLVLTATTMTSSKKDIKERIVMIAKKPKTAAYTLIAVILIAALATGCTFTGPKSENDSSDDNINQSKTLFDCGGLTVAIPGEYADRLYISEDIPEDSPEDQLFRVYDKQSYEASLNNPGESSEEGFMLAIVRHNQAEHERYLSSKDGGLRFFAKDKDYYYGYRVANDFHFLLFSNYPYTEDADRSNLKAAVKAISEDFVSRNKLTKYSDDEFWAREFSYDSEHVFINYYPLYADWEQLVGCKYEDLVYTLVLSQPAKQSENGIWCVERWYDSGRGELVHHCFPAYDNQTDMPAAEYYAQLQAECDAGTRPELLDPMQVAMEFAATQFGYTLGDNSLEILD